MKKSIIKKIFRPVSVILLILLVAALPACSFAEGIKNIIPINCGGASEKEDVKPIESVYLASDQNEVAVYSLVKDEETSEEKLTEAMSRVRGTEVYSYNEYVNMGTEETPDEYLKIFLEEAAPEDESLFYYVKPDNVAADPRAVVKEKDKFVRTSVTVYQNAAGAEIAGFAKKGSALSVEDFDDLNEDGSVNKYKVSVPESDVSGWVYAKYLVDTQEDADAVNQPIYDIHKDRIYTDLDLMGGAATTLDWYPVEKPVFEKELAKDAKTMYLCAEAAVNNGGYLDLINTHDIDAVVIDIKDGQLAYASDVAAELAPTAYNGAFVSPEEYKAAVAAFKDAGVYVIGRVVCFSDEQYAADHPETCIESPESTRAWPSAYNRDAWYYNVSLALEAVELCGFDEIQFDYVRFPENAYGMSQNPETDYKNEYDEEKAETIQNFCFYAADCIHEAGAYFSVDVFGECADEYVSAYGQYWPAISNVVDAISGMPYTDHYGPETDTWTFPYEIVYTFAERAAKRQTEIETPAEPRTWITGYDTPNWEPTVVYDEGKLVDQINALYDSGLRGGFIPWNGVSNINKYHEYAGIWDKTYPTGDEAVKEAPTEAAPVEEAPAEEVPMEEAPAEEVYYEEPVYEEEYVAEY